MVSAGSAVDIVLNELITLLAHDDIVSLLTILLFMKHLAWLLFLENGLRMSENDP